MDLRSLLLGKKKPKEVSFEKEITELFKPKEVEKMAGEIINKRFVSYLNENGETKKIPPEAFAVTEHIEEHEMKDNGIATGKILRIYYSYLVPVSEEAEPEPEKEEPKKPVVVARRK